MTTKSPEMTFDQLLSNAKFRHEDLNPIDRQSKLGNIRLILANPDQVQEKDFAPRWGMTSPGIEGFPDVVEFSDHALGQFCSKKMLDFNPSLLNRLRPDYAFRDVNHLLEFDLPEKGSYIRMIHGSADGITATARAILGSRFTPLDDLELLTVCDEFLKDGIVRYHGNTGRTSHFTVTFPSERRADGVEPGIHIANSEVGVRSVTIQSVLFREICNNILPRIDMLGGFGQDRGGDIYIRDSDVAHDLKGARKGIVEGGWRFIHIGNHDKLQTFVKNAVEEATAKENPMLAMWDRGLSQIVDDPAQALRQIAKLSKLPKEDHDTAVNAFALESYESGPDFANTVTGVANAFTRAANGQEEAEKRYHFQVAGANAFRLLN